MLIYELIFSPSVHFYIVEANANENEDNESNFSIVTLRMQQSTPNGVIKLQKTDKISFWNAWPIIYIFLSRQYQEVMPCVLEANFICWNNIIKWIQLKSYGFQCTCQKWHHANVLPLKIPQEKISNNRLIPPWRKLCAWKFCIWKWWWIGNFFFQIENIFNSNFFE